MKNIQVGRANEATGVLGRPRTMLDVGCGYGVTGGAIRARGAYVVGIEREADAAKRELNEVIKADPSDGDAIARAVSGRKFDLVLLQGNALHGDLPGLVKKMVGLLEPQGHVALCVPVNGLGRAGAERTLRDAGLEVTRVEPRAGALRAAPSLLADRVAHEIVAMGRPPTKPGPLSLTVGMLTMNEEESIARMIDEIRKYAPDAQILCVDSTTKDRTNLIAEEMGARVIRQLPPRGHGPAMEVLMYEAAKQSDALIYLDCDFTYPAENIPVIRKLLEAGADVVNGARTRKKPEHMPMANYMANKTFVYTARMMHGVPIGDLHSGMRGYRRGVTHAFDFDGEGDAIPIDTLLWPAKSGYHVVEIGIDYNERVGFSKLRKMAGTYWTFVRLARTLAVGSRWKAGYDIR
jgi:SAM-dependent methyltransferase